MHPKIGYLHMASAVMHHIQDPKMRPAVFKFLYRRGVKRLWCRCTGKNSIKDHQDPQALAWCNERVISVEQLSEELSLTNTTPWVCFNDAEPKSIEKAEQALKECPFPFQQMQLAGNANLDLIYNLVRHFKPHTALETGVALGWSSLAFLCAFEKNGKGRLVSTDMPYLIFRAENWVGAAVPPELRDRMDWTLIRYPDDVALPEALRSITSLDLCHYDSDKSEAGRRWAYPLIWERLSSGGILISDDISDNRAFEYFCNDMGQDPWIVASDGRHVGVLRKP